MFSIFNSKNKQLESEKNYKDIINTFDSVLTATATICQNYCNPKEKDNYFKQLANIYDIVQSLKNINTITDPYDKREVIDYLFYNGMAILVCLYSNYQGVLRRNDPNIVNAIIIQELEKISQQIELFSEQIKKLPTPRLPEVENLSELNSIIDAFKDRNRSYAKYEEILSKYLGNKVYRYKDNVDGPQEINEQTRNMQIILNHIVTYNNDLNAIRVNTILLGTVINNLIIILFPGSVNEVSYNYNQEDILKVQWHNLIINQEFLLVYKTILSAISYNSRFLGISFRCNVEQSLIDLERNFKTYMENTRHYVSIPIEEREQYINLELCFKLAINRYTNNHIYIGLNRFLRSDFSEINRIVDDEERMKYCKLLLLDIALVTKGLEKLPKFKGTLFRGEGNGFMTHVLPHIEVSSESGGSLVKYPGFTSTGKNEASIFFTNNAVQILSTDGRAGGVCIAPFSEFTDEEEVLFPPGTKMQPVFLCVKDNRNVTIVEAIPACVDFINNWKKEFVYHMFNDDSYKAMRIVQSIDKLSG